MALIAGAAAIGLVAWFVLVHLVVIAVGLAAAAVLTVGCVVFLRRFMVVAWRQYAPRPALPRAVTAELAGQRHQAVAQPRQAIERGQHVHFHFHGDMSAAHAEAIRQAVTARPVTEEEPPVNLTAVRRVR